MRYSGPMSTNRTMINVAGMTAVAAMRAMDDGRQAAQDLRSADAVHMIGQRLLASRRRVQQLEAENRQLRNELAKANLLLAHARR